MIVCPKCSSDNPDTARFCMSCAAPLAVGPPAEEQRKTVTALFCDVSGSTALGERLDPESLRRVMARYFERARRVIEGHGGTVEKFIGDAVMAVFGVPVLHEDDALRAVRAAHELRESLDDLNVELARDFGTKLEIRLGVNTGEVVTVGDELLATGDAVNVAARLEQAAAPGQILIGQETLGLTRDAVEVEPVEPLALKGKAQPVPAFRLVSVRSGAQAVGRRQDVPMVGRERELRDLELAFLKAKDNRSCQLFTILGSAGVGKSRLVHEFLSSLQGATILRGNCLSYGEGITYWPVLEVIQELGPRLDDLLPDDRSSAVIRGLLGKQETASSTEEIAWAFRKLLEAAAIEQPVVCVFDDAHWGEESFLDLIEHVVDLSRGSAILVLCMARPELLDRRPTWSGGKLNATTILLEPLGESEAELLIEKLVAGEHLDQSLRTRIREAAEGNPFFCEQLVALSEGSESQSVTVPSTIQSLLAARLDQLDPAERGVLARGSVEGRIFHRGAVQALAPEETQVMARLTSLVRRELIRPNQPQFPDEEAFRFKHLLIRDATYDGLSKSTRAQLHERFAVWLKEHGLDLLELDEILGYHLERAYRYREELGPVDEAGTRLAVDAGKHLAAAGVRALGRGDVPGAMNLLGRGFRLVPDAERDIEIDLVLAQALTMAGRPHDAIAVAASAAERAETNGDEIGALKARMHEERTRLHLGPEGSIERLRVLATAALPVLEAAGDHAGLASAWQDLALVENQLAHFGAMADAAERAIEYVRSSRNPMIELESLRQAAMGYAMGPKPVTEGLQWFDSSLASFSSSPLAAAVLAVRKALLVAMSGNFDEARAMATESQRRYQELGMTLHVAGMAQTSCAIELLTGRFVAAEELAREGCEALIRMGERTWLSTLACQLAESLLRLNRDDEAHEWAERGRQDAGSDDILTQMLWRSVQARVLARRGEFGPAMGLMGEALTLVVETDMLNIHGDLLMAQAEVLELAGQREEATEARRKALELYRQKGNVASVRTAQAALNVATV